MTTETRDDVQELRNLFAMFMDGDKWGDTLNFHFAIAEVLYRRGADIPASWEYRPGAGLEHDVRVNGPAPTDSDDCVVAMLWDSRLSDSALIYWGDVLGHYGTLLRAAGLEY